jgi:hypothetical protein
MTTRNNNIRNLRAVGSKVISSEVELEIIKISEEFGFTSPPIRSASAKEIRLCNFDRVDIYVSRITSLSKGFLKLAVHPKLSEKLDVLVKADIGIQIKSHAKFNSRNNSSSNFNDFDSIGYCKNISSEQPQCSDYLIDVNENYDWLKVFLNKFKSVT